MPSSGQLTKKHKDLIKIILWKIHSKNKTANLSLPEILGHRAENFHCAPALYKSCNWNLLTQVNNPGLTRKHSKQNLLNASFAWLLFVIFFILVLYHILHLLSTFWLIFLLSQLTSAQFIKMWAHFSGLSGTREGIHSICTYLKFSFCVLCVRNAHNLIIGKLRKSLGILKTQQAHLTDGAHHCRNSHIGSPVVERETK